MYLFIDKRKVTIQDKLIVVEKVVGGKILLRYRLIIVYISIPIFKCNTLKYGTNSCSALPDKFQNINISLNKIYDLFYTYLLQICPIKETYI